MFVGVITVFHCWSIGRAARSRSQTAARVSLGLAILLTVGCAVMRLPEPLQSPPLISVSQATVSQAAVARTTQVAIVVSEDLQDYRQLSYVFATQLGRPYQLFELAHRSEESVRQAVRNLHPQSVVALGRSALDVVSQIDLVDIVYAGVFNADPAHRGVDAIPPFEMQLHHWRVVSPHIRRIGVVGSAASQDRIDALARASDEIGLELHRREVKSDKEALLAFRAMVPYIDGFVFLPDERVLSPDVIRRVLAHGKHNDLQILVYSPVMFAMGAFLYIGSDPVDVAAQIIELLNSGDQSQALTKMRTRRQHIEVIAGIPGV